MAETKKLWYCSKTLWLNIISITVIVAQGKFGYVVGPEFQVAILAIVNVILRAATKQEILWAGSKK